jgi:hypothetical protein
VPALTSRPNGPRPPTHSLSCVSGSFIALVAHQGGWDEFLLVAAPIVVVGGLLWIAKRRVDRAAQRRSDSLDTGTDGR